MLKRYISEKNQAKQVKRGFTLSEILITLLIIGVVASLVIPAIINDFQDADWKVSYRKAFSVASQALNSAIANNSLVSRIDYNDSDNSWIIFNAFKSKFNVIKDCNNSNNSQCWAAGEVWRRDAPLSNAPAFIDNSGMAWSMRGLWSAGANKVVSIILVDTNGNKLPNKYGKDRYVLIVTNKSQMPKNIYTDSTAFWEILYDISKGYPVTIIPFPDAPNTNDVCPSGNCFYTSSLK